MVQGRAEMQRGGGQQAEPGLTSAAMAVATLMLAPVAAGAQASWCPRGTQQEPFWQSISSWPSMTTGRLHVWPLTVFLAVTATASRAETCCWPMRLSRGEQ